MLRQFILRYKNSLMWALVILILCGMPPSGIPKIRIPGLDKIVHFGLFAVFSVLLITEQNTQRNQLTVKGKYLLRGFTIAVLYGGLIELMQLWIFIGRGAEWYDFIADAIGAGIATLMYPLINRVLKGYL
ncbi:VanZ family protein [Tenuifilum sp.]|uniref:VanZ family protein n=1 Tax=Tenuifilum sp. TaxID=2760880 RepID=UPI002583A378|nr:VanZ family protein [Tenuifilum sp.]